MNLKDFPQYAIDDLSDPRWRLRNLYTIVDRDANVIPFRPNEAQADLLEELHYRNVILKARQRGFCLDPSTRVLTADLRWVAIDSIKPGDELVAVDENIPGGKGATRQMRTTKVVAKRESVKDAYRITFDDGRTVICSADHRWLSRSAGVTQTKWRALGTPGKSRLKVGCSVRWVCHPWAIGGHEDGWFGGLLDGEGSLALPKRNGGSINISQREGGVFDRAESYLRTRGYSYRREQDGAERKSKHGKVPVPKLVVSRLDEMFRLVGQTRPSRFLSRRFWEGKELPGKRSAIGWSEIVHVEKLDTRRLVDIQTECGTFIAEGFVSHNSTFVQLMALDQAIFNDNFTAGIIADNLDNAGVFLDRIEFAYRHLPEAIRQANPLTSANSTTLEFKNGSRIVVDTSFRSGTLQFLHVSEFGKICAKHPDKAKEIMTGTLPALAPSGFAVIESTAEGKEGYFFTIVKDAENKALLGTQLTKLDFKFHFYSWWDEDQYQLDPGSVQLTQDEVLYCHEVEGKIGRKLEPSRWAWYWATRRIMGDTMLQEHPSTPDEAFWASAEGRYYTQQMTKVRNEQRIGRFPHDPRYPVHTFWDIGSNDETAIWCMQIIDRRLRFIHYHEKDGETFGYFVRHLKDLGYTWAQHWLPHDAAHKRQQGLINRTAEEMIKELAPGWVTEIVERIPDVALGIQQTRDMFPLVEIDEAGCSKGIAHLDNYRKEWNERTGAWKSTPFHGPESNGADAFRQCAQVLAAGLLKLPSPIKEISTRRGARGHRSWRTV